MLEPRQLYNIFHPFIDSIYLKKEFSSGAREKGTDILVIEAKRAGKTVPGRVRNHLLLSFLADLDLIRDEVERKVGKFSRIDIRCC